MSMRFGIAHCVWRRLVVCGLLLAATPSAQEAIAQGLSFGQSRPFVVGIIPVVGRNGAVGGVLVDAAGVVARAEVKEQVRLRAAWQAALRPATGDLSRTAPLRKISLRRLEEAIAGRLAAKQSVTDEMNYLAGLQQVQYVFVDPEQRDLVLAGSAEPWRVTEHGALVGQNSGRPVLLLEDLLISLRSSEAAAESGIWCSIDPSAEGLARLRRVLRSRAAFGAASLQQLEQTLGPQLVTVEGVPADSRFARVMVSADFLMKRMAMGFEPAPVSGLPSYLQMVTTGAAAPPRTMTPRWWLAPNYEPLRRDDAGLAWEVGNRSIKAFSDDGGPARKSVAADPWAERFTAKYDELSIQLPVFAELQNCMDLAVVAALIAKEDLRSAAGFPMELLLDGKRLPTGAWFTPQTIPSQASAVARGRETIVSVSGGVEFDPWAIVQQTEETATLTALRTKAAPPAEPRWWWD
jgi:hypothetical protein